MLMSILSASLKRENRLLTGMSLVTAVIFAILVLHYVFGFWPTHSYLTN